MYSGGSVVGKASLIDLEISPITLLIFTEGQKVRNLSHFRHHLTLSRPRLKMQQDISTLKQTSSAAMIALCPRQHW